MSVLIKGMEKPEHCGYCRFRYDGICHALQKTQYSMNECPLVVIDDAGLNDTISRQAAIGAIEKESQVDGAYGYMDTKSIVDLLNDLPSAQPEISRIEQGLHGKTPEEQYEFLYWLLSKFALTYTDSRLAVIEWLRGEKEE